MDLIQTCFISAELEQLHSACGVLVPTFDCYNKHFQSLSFLVDYKWGKITLFFFFRRINVYAALETNQKKPHLLVLISLDVELNT